MNHGKQSVKRGHWPACNLLGLATAGLGAGPLTAGTANGTMAATVTVEESCHIDARPLVFGAAPVENGRIEAKSSVVLACTPAASYVVTLDEGRHGAGGTRRMAAAAGTDFLAYELYSDAARTRRWGATAASAVGAVAPADGVVELAVFARLSTGHVLAGDFGDTVTVTVSF